ncbi:hypothetical protein CDD83_6837 [Cordyceps sp. RAO-2017]|nr:hypothetical protein CDD83_6837 [Cordyceps sp. RAO-2017]
MGGNQRRGTWACAATRWHAEVSCAAYLKQFIRSGGGPGPDRPGTQADPLSEGLDPLFSSHSRPVIESPFSPEAIHCRSCTRFAGHRDHV